MAGEDIRQCQNANASEVGLTVSHLYKPCSPRTVADRMLPQEGVSLTTRILTVNRFSA